RQCIVKKSSRSTLGHSVGAGQIVESDLIADSVSESHDQYTPFRREAQGRRFIAFQQARAGEKDNVLSMLLEQLRRELTTPHRPSPLFVQSIAQSLAIHLSKKPKGQTERLRHRSELASLPGASVLCSSGVNIGRL